MISVHLDRIPLKNRHKSMEWLIETYGPMGSRWTFNELSKIVFYKDRDATMFLMRWS